MKFVGWTVDDFLTITNTFLDRQRLKSDLRVEGAGLFVIFVGEWLYLKLEI
jgi:hypothetical protein